MEVATVSATQVYDPLGDRLGDGVTSTVVVEPHRPHEMNLSFQQSQDRLAGQDHGVLATLHPTRGADLVPVVYAVANGHLGVPVDLVKPKSSTRLQRERNLESDPRATLLVERWDRDDWSKLWWVRAQLRWLGDETDARLADLAERLASRLADRHAQYRERPFARVLVFRIDAVTGWAAEVG